MKNLKECRKQKNITQIRLSIEAEVSQETISAYESGKAMPSVETLLKIAKFLNVSIDYLLGRTDNPLVNEYETSKDNELLSIYHQLDKKQKEDLLTYAKIRKQM